MIVNQANLDNIFAGYQGAFNKGFEGAKSYYKSVAMLTRSTTAQENYGWLAQMPKMREWFGDRVIGNLSAHNYTVPNKKFESTVEVDRTSIEDDSYGVFSNFFQEMGRAAAENPDDMTFTLMKNGFSEVCYDGQYFFDTDHKVVDENGSEYSVSNSGGGTGAAWFLLDTSRAVRPFIYQERIAAKLTALDADNDRSVFMKDKFTYGVRARSAVGYGLWQLAYGSKQTLNDTSYAVARAAMMSQKGDGARPLGVVPTLLVVDPSNEQAGRELLVNERLANGESNPWRGSVELIVTPWLA